MTRRGPEYSAWSHAIQRCNNPSDKGWKNYGGRGIKICDRWRSFDAFLEDVGPRPSPTHSLDRIDVDGHYEPGNVRWATRVEQARNTRANTHITHEGLTLCLAEWAERVRVPTTTLIWRMQKGWSMTEVLSTASLPPTHQRNRRGPKRRLPRAALAKVGGAT